ncbi:1-aminocyclopropane-1-carboxylate oxidase 5 [Bienertia sinuspersici]
MLNELVEKNNGEKLEGVHWEDVFLLTDDNDWRQWQSYGAELKKLAGKLIEIMDENLGLPKGYIMKAFNYGEENNNETAFFGTKMLKGEEWLDVQPVQQREVQECLALGFGKFYWE